MQSQAERLVRNAFAALPHLCAASGETYLGSLQKCKQLAANAWVSDTQLEIYEDADGSRKEEITSLKGEDPMQ